MGLNVEHGPATDGAGAEGGIAALLCALSFATGIALGERMEHGLKSAYVGLQVAEALRLGPAEREAVFYGALLKDAGCTACAAGIAAFFLDDQLVPKLDLMLVDPSSMSELMAWMSRNVPVDARLPARIARLFSFLVQCGPVIREAMLGHCEIAELFARRLGFPEHVQRAVRFQLEWWNGKGRAYGLRGDAVPVAARILHPAQMFELAHHFGGPSAARATLRERRGGRFDPEIVDTLLAVAERPGFWDVLALEEARDEVLAMRPPTAADRTVRDGCEPACEALADFADIKTPDARDHSRVVADLAAAIGARLGLGAAEQTRLRRAGLLHDLGAVGIPFGILAKEALSAGEREQFELHPYYTQKVLERVAPLAELANEASAHHEWLDGRGYHRGLAGGQVPRAGRILAVADAFARLHQRGAEPERALAQLRPLAGARLDGDAVAALAGAIGGAPAPRRRAARSAGPVTEREAEVLRLLARGLNNPQIATSLVVSRKTVERHLENIYNKLGISSRTAAVAYAVQQGLA
jgi:HD-GYP domain-containing protein (c-di-GMP phosphodiesterase class II)